MIRGKLLSYGDDLKEVYGIRKEVFVKELGLSKEEEFDFEDSSAVHVVVYDEKLIHQKEQLTPVATGRITYDGEVCEIAHISVLKEYRNQEYGDFALRMLINRAMISGIEEIVLYSPKNIVAFFERVGFIRLIRDEHQNIEPIKMVLNLKNISTMCHCK